MWDELERGDFVTWTPEYVGLIITKSDEQRTPFVFIWHVLLKKQKQNKNKQKTKHPICDTRTKNMKQLQWHPLHSQAMMIKTTWVWYNIFLHPHKLPWWLWLLYIGTFHGHLILPVTCWMWCTFLPETSRVLLAGHIITPLPNYAFFCVCCDTTNWCKTQPQRWHQLCIGKDMTALPQMEIRWTSIY